MSSLGLVSKQVLMHIVVKAAPKYFYGLPRWFYTLRQVSRNSPKFRTNSPQVPFSTCPKPHSENKYTVTFVKASGDQVTAKGKEGDSLLDVVVNNNLDFDGFGACEGTLTCSTCHCIFKQEDYDKLPEKPSDEELDMLDLAYDLTDTSRLGCQIQLSKELDGLEVKIPATINDARS